MNFFLRSFANSYCRLRLYIHRIYVYERRRKKTRFISLMCQFSQSWKLLKTTRKIIAIIITRRRSAQNRTIKIHFRSKYVHECCVHKMRHSTEMNEWFMAFRLDSFHCFVPFFIFYLLFFSSLSFRASHWLCNLITYYFFSSMLVCFPSAHFCFRIIKYFIGSSALTIFSFCCDIFKSKWCFSHSI